LVRTLVAILVVALLTALPGAVLCGAGTPSRADALSLKQKIAGIAAFGEQPPPAARMNRTTVTENEVNAFLQFEEQLPPGVVEPVVTILGTGRVSARAIVDLDLVKKQRPSRGLLDPVNLMTGRLPVEASGVLKTSNGVGHFELESASVSSIRIPKVFLQEIVSYYSRTPANPAGIGLDDPFVLPARIREIQVEPGRAIVVQ
jgi:hypothetical protein